MSENDMRKLEARRVLLTNAVNKSIDFVGMVSRLKTTAEFDMAQEDAFESIDDLILSARAIVKLSTEASLKVNTEEPTVNDAANMPGAALLRETIEELHNALTYLKYLKPEKFDNEAHEALWNEGVARKETILAGLRML